MLTEDILIKKPDDTWVEIRKLSVGDEIMTADGDSQTVEDVIIRGYADTYAVVANNGGNKKVLYATLDTKLVASDDKVVSVEDLRMNTILKSVGKILGVALSGERKVYNLVTEEPFVANEFIVNQ